MKILLFIFELFWCGNIKVVTIIHVHLLSNEILFYLLEVQYVSYVYANHIRISLCAHFKVPCFTYVLHSMKYLHFLS